MRAVGRSFHKESHALKRTHTLIKEQSTQLPVPAIRFDPLPARARRLRNLDLAM